MADSRMADTTNILELPLAPLAPLPVDMDLPTRLDGPNAHGIEETLEALDVCFLGVATLIEALKDGAQVSDVRLFISGEFVGTLRKGLRGIGDVDDELRDLTLNEAEALSEHIRASAFNLVRRLRA